MTRPESHSSEPTPIPEAHHWGRIPLPATFLSLAYADFRYLWTGTLFTGGAQWIQQVSLGWLAYEMTDSALVLGIALGLRTLPFLFAPLVGVMADRMERRLLMVAGQIFLAVLSLVFAMDIAFDWIRIWHIYLFGVLVGVGTIFTQTLRLVMLPQTVPSGALTNAIALNYMANNVTRILGPALGGFLIATVSVSGNFYIQSACYLVAALVTLLIRQRGIAEGERQNPWQSVTTGIVYLRDNRTLLTLIVVGTLFVIISLPFQNMLPIFASDILSAGPEGLGLLMSAAGLGALAGTFILATLHGVRRQGFWLMVLGPAMGVVLFFFAISRTYALSVLLMAVMGIVQMSYFTLYVSMLQVLIPERVRGRVMSLAMLDVGIMPVASILLGFLAQTYGAPLAVALEGGLIVALFVVVILTIPSFRHLAANSASSMATAQGASADDTCVASLPQRTAEDAPGEPRSGPRPR